MYALDLVVDFDFETLVIVKHCVINFWIYNNCDGSCQRIYMTKMKKSLILGSASIIGMYVTIF